MTRTEPFERYEFVTVEFILPDTDVRVPHTLNPEAPDDVVYLIVSSSGDGNVYDSRTTAGGLAWTRTSIVLRTNRAPATVVCLLALRRAA